MKINKKTILLAIIISTTVYSFIKIKNGLKHVWNNGLNKVAFYGTIALSTYFIIALLFWLIGN